MNISRLTLKHSRSKALFSTEQLRARILGGAGAAALSQGVTAAIQLVSVPLFISTWTAEQYAFWLVLTAIPAYLALAEGGIVASVGTTITQSLAQGDSAAASNAYSRGLYGATLVSLALVAVTIAIAFLLPAFGSSLFKEYAFAICAVLLTVPAGIFTSLVCQPLRATGKAATSELILLASRLLEFTGLACALVLSGDLGWVAFGGLSGKVVGLAIAVAASRQLDVHVVRKLRVFSMVELRTLAASSMGYVQYPIATALSVQGMTIICAAALSAQAVITLNAYRVLWRLVVQLTGVTGTALWPEFSFLHGSNRYDKLNELYRRFSRINLLGSVLGCMFLSGALPYILRIWTNDGVEPSVILCVLMSLYAVASSMCHTPRILVLAAGSYGRLGTQYILCAMAGILAALALAAAGFGIVGIVAAMVLTETLTFLCSRAAAHQTLRGSSENLM